MTMARPDTELLGQLRSGFAQQKKRAQYNKDPQLWANDKLSVHLWSVQKEILESVRDNYRTTVASCHGSGKALALDTMLMTPHGYMPMGQVQVGDKLLDQQGRATLVTAVTPKHLHKSTEISFLHTATRNYKTDGIVASLEHEWAVLTPQAQSRIRVLCARRGITEPDWSYWMHRTTVLSTQNLMGHVVNRTANASTYIVPGVRPLNTALSSRAQHYNERALRPNDPIGVHTYASLLALMAKYGTVDRLGRVCLRMTVAANKAGTPSAAEKAIKGVRGFSYPPELIDADTIFNSMKLRPTLTKRTQGHTHIYELAISADPTRLLQLAEMRGQHEDKMNHLDAQAIALQAADEKALRPDVGGWCMIDMSRVHNAWVKCVQVDSELHLYQAGKCNIPTHNSMIASVAASWWVDSHPAGTAIVVSTAPTYAQVHAILWEEIRKHHNRAKAAKTPLPGSVTMADNWNLPDGTLAGYGRKPKDGDQHAFQGIHRRFVLVIIDEACGVPSELWTGAEAITTNEGCRILVIGNPDDRDTDFGKSFEDPTVAHMWNRIRIPASVTPNLTGEPVPPLLNEVLVSKKWCDDALTRWGADDPRYISKVLAQFPEQSEASLFSPAVIATAFEDNKKKHEEPPFVLYFGVDCARYGTDLNTLVCYDGIDARVISSWGGLDTVSSAIKALTLIEDEINTYKVKWRDVPCRIIADIRVDSVGLGAGVVDTMSAKRAEIAQELERQGSDEGPWFLVREMSGSAAPPKDVGGSIQGYGNARAWWYDQTKHLMRADAVNIAEHAKLKEELEGIRYKYKNGKLYIESKEEMRDRGVKSPDFADALIYAVAPVHEGAATGDTVSAKPQEVVAEAADEDLEMMHENRIAPY